MKNFDFIIVGAGSAGAIIASRLSENLGNKILLLEAGPDYADEAATPPSLLDARDVEGVHDWGYTATAIDSRSIPYQRGKVTGGTSAINATAFQWPRPSDIEEWVRRGNTDWSWLDVAPHLKKIETDRDGIGEHHGTDGPVPVSRFPNSDLIPIQRAFYDACRASEFDDVRDHNSLIDAGVGPFPMNRSDQKRVSTALSHIAPARNRQNLVIRSDVLVDNVAFEGAKAVGVRLSDGSLLHARSIILAAGSIGSPAILLRSGIGPKQEVEAHGIKSKLNVPGLGARLWDHPGIPIRLVPLAGECVMGRDPRVQIMASYTATASSCERDMQLVLRSHLNISGAPALKAEAGVPVVAALIVALMAPRSYGRLTIASSDPASPPTIELNFFDDAEDMRRALDGVRRAWEVLHKPSFLTAYERISGLTEDIVQSDIELAAYIRSSCGTYCHAMGTAPMGPDTDPMAVVDQGCKVHRTDNLYVVDASIIPAALSVVPNMTVMMLAERFAQWHH